MHHQTAAISTVYIYLCTFEEALLADAVGVHLRGGGGGRALPLWGRRLRGAGGQQGQQRASVMPARVVGEVGANEAVGELQLLLDGHARHLHHEAAIVPTVNWTWGGGR